MLAACATTVPTYNRGWATHEQPGAAMLTYGVPQSDDVDLFAVCDLEAKVFELAFFTGDSVGETLPKTRTELIVGPEDAPRSLMAAVQAREGTGEMMVVARTALPPEFIAGWAGKRVTIAGEGVAMTLLARPDKAMIDTFLKRCGAN